MSKYLKAVVLFCYVFFYAKIRNFFWGFRGRCHICVLVYHRVSDEYKDSVTVGVEQFKNQIELLQKKYEIVAPDELSFLQNSRIKKPVVAITFDDGYEDNYAAAKFLAEKGIRAAFFLSTGIVGTDRSFPHDLKRLGHAVPVLHWEQVRDMADWGHVICSHTSDHINLATVDTSHAVRLINEGKDDLARFVGKNATLNIFAYPHGRKEDLPAEVKELLPELGIRYCYSAYGGINFVDFDPYDIRRQGVDSGFSTLAFLALVEGWIVRMPDRIAR